MCGREVFPNCVGAAAAAVVVLTCLAGCVGAGSESSSPVVDLGPSLQALLEDYVRFSGESSVGFAVDAPGLRNWLGFAGVQNIDSGKSVASDSAFRVGSTTKALVAATVMLLVEEGLLGLDDPLSKWVEGYPAWEAITVRQLLGMRSGIPDYLMDQLLWLGVVLEPGKPVSPQELLANVSDAPLEFEPGQTCRYSNTNFILLGLVIEAVSGHPAHEEIRDRIMLPLGLEHTYLDVSGKVDERLVHGYMDPRMAFMELNLSPDLIALIPKDMLASEGLVDCTYLAHPSLSWTAGALVTTPLDMIRTMRSLLAGMVVGDFLLQQMKESGPCEIPAETSDYGLGMMAWDTPLGRAYGHGGLMYGYSGKTGYVEAADLVYSYSVGSYPAQEEILVDEVLRALESPAEAVIPPTCVPPDSFPDPSSDLPRLDLRFRGRLNSADAVTVEGGIANLTAHMGQTRYLLHGRNTAATLLEAGSTVGDAAAVRIDSSGPPCTGSAHASRCVVTLPQGLFSAAPGTDGILHSRGSATDGPSVLVWDVWHDPETFEPVKECVVAVADRTRDFALFVCDADTLPEAGRLLRLFGSIGLTQEPQAVDDALASADVSRCHCRDGAAWASCP